MSQHLPELDRLPDELKTEEAKAKSWFAANKTEAISIACAFLGLGMVLGAAAVHFLK